MEHTKEPWEWSEHKFNAPPFEGTLDHECGIYPPDGEAGPVAIASGEGNARRIVACVNACAGVTTEELEQGGFVAGLVERLEDAPRWRDVVDELPQEAQEVLFVRGGKTVHGAWIGGIFWHNNQKMAAATWMPLPKPPKVGADTTAAKTHNVEFSGTPAASSPEAPLERRVGGAVPPAPTFGGSET